MATERFPLTTSVYIPVSPGSCPEVVICLPEANASNVTTGIPLFKATVLNTGRRLGGRGVVPTFENVRGAEEYQYEIEVDLDQFTGEFTLTCDLFGDVFVPACFYDAILAAIQALDERVVVLEEA